MKKYLYLYVTKDEFELPIFVTDSLSKLSEFTGDRVDNIRSQISKYENGILKTGRYRKVLIQEEKKQMKNTLSDLNNYLFEQIERLQDANLDNDSLNKEINRSKAISQVSAQIINNAKIALDAQKHFDDIGYDVRIINPLLGCENGSE